MALAYYIDQLDKMLDTNIIRGFVPALESNISVKGSFLFLYFYVSFNHFQLAFGHWNN